MTTYNAPIGTALVAGGKFAPPAWVTALAPNTWTALGASSFKSQAIALVGIETQWPGTAALGSIIDAFGDPVIDGEDIYFNGGGHGDGYWNGIMKVGMETLSMSVQQVATPGFCYPVGFPTTNNWPSGQGVDWMRTAAQHAPADLAFAAPFSAPRQTHEYGAQAVRNKPGVQKQIIWFYNAHKIYDFGTGTWTNRHESSTSFVTQRVATQADIQSPGLGTNIGPTVSLQQGTMAVYDDVTDKFFVTMVPGDGGGGWRNFFFKWDPATDTCPQIYRPTVPCRESMVWVKAGRHIFGIVSPYSVAYPSFSVYKGFRFNIDTEVIDYFDVTGNIPAFEASLAPEWVQEAVPYTYDSTRNMLVGWSHNQADRGNLYELPLSTFGTAGGTGTSADPYLWPQAKVAISNPPANPVSFRYNGLFYIQKWGVFVVFPHSDKPGYAFKRTT
jgi:hypothetical protein